MAIVQTLTVYGFRDAFYRAGRKDHFSYKGLSVLFEALEELSESTGEDIELDVTGLCCDWEEYSLDEINYQYGEEFEYLDEAEEWLRDQAFVAGSTADSVVFMAF